MSEWEPKSRIYIYLCVYTYINKGNSLESQVAELEFLRVQKQIRVVLSDTVSIFMALEKPG